MRMWKRFILLLLHCLSGFHSFFRCFCKNEMVVLCLWEQVKRAKIALVCASYVAVACNSSISSSSITIISIINCDHSGRSSILICHICLLWIFFFTVQPICDIERSPIFLPPFVHFCTAEKWWIYVNLFVNRLENFIPFLFENDCCCGSHFCCYSLLRHAVSVGRMPVICCAIVNSIVDIVDTFWWPKHLTRFQ